MTLWQGRFGGRDRPTSCWPTRSAFPTTGAWPPTTSTGTRAHVRGLAGPGSSRPASADTLLAALDRVAEELAAGIFVFQPGDEDVHTAVERRVTEIAGDVGARLHTGRSRNDQIATDLRLFTKRELDEVGPAGPRTCSGCCSNGPEAAEDAYLPGYTHLQRAQPVLLAHHLLAHGWALARDVDRLADTRRRLDVSPLGAGALAGSSLALDPDWCRRRPRVRRPLRELPRRRVRPGLRGRGALRPGPARRPPVPHRRGDRPVVDRGVRLLSPRRRLRHRQLDAPPEEEPRYRRAGPGQGGPADRPSDRAPGHAQGAARWPTTGTCRRTRSRCSTRSTRSSSGSSALAGLLDTAAFDTVRMRAAADTPGRRRRRPGRVAGGARDALPPGPRDRRRPGAGRRSSATCRWPSWSRPTRLSAQKAVALLEPGVAVTRRTTPGGAGPGPVAVQLKSFAEQLAARRRHAWPAS